MEDAVEEHSIEVRGEIADLARVTEILDGVWESHNLDVDLSADLNIAIEEALSNTIRHGGVSSPIRMLVALGPLNIRVEIEDQGVAFNPLDQPLPDPNMPLDQRRAGGMGILLFRTLMDSAAYERRDGHNRLTLVKKLPSARSNA